MNTAYYAYRRQPHAVLIILSNHSSLKSLVIVSHVPHTQFGYNSKTKGKIIPNAHLLYQNVRDSSQVATL